MRGALIRVNMIFIKMRQNMSFETKSLLFWNQISKIVIAKLDLRK